MAEREKEESGYKIVMDEEMVDDDSLQGQFLNKSR